MKNFLSNRYKSIWKGWLTAIDKKRSLCMREKHIFNSFTIYMFVAPHWFSLFVAVCTFLLLRGRGQSSSEQTERSLCCGGAGVASLRNTTAVGSGIASLLYNKPQHPAHTRHQQNIGHRQGMFRCDCQVIDNPTVIEWALFTNYSSTRAWWLVRCGG